MDKGADILFVSPHTVVGTWRHTGENAMMQPEEGDTLTYFRSIERGSAGDPGVSCPVLRPNETSTDHLPVYAENVCR